MPVNRQDAAPILIHNGYSTLKRVELASPAGEFDEAWLQKLLFDCPECLPIGEIEPGFGPLVSICRELPTRHGPVDNLFMTGSGDIVIVEAKLWRNPQSRREVVAQALDYASCLFEMTYEQLEAAILKAALGRSPKPQGVYELFREYEALPEPQFIDAVSRNLRRGRIVVLVVGDGIRSETERLAAALQSHAGFHFTFALVELAVFRTPIDGSFLVLPRTLARTVMIERGIVRIEAGNVVVTSPANQTGTDTGQGAPLSITAEQFFDAMGQRDPALPDKLKDFIAKIEPLGVYPDFQRSLNLKWDPPEGKPINLGYIKRSGEVWTDAANWFVADKALSHGYVEDLARRWGMDVERVKLGSTGN
jgi:hypothetical protein